MGFRKSREEVRRQRRWGLALVILGVVLIGSAAGLVMYNDWDSDRAGRESEKILEEMDTLLEEMEVKAPLMPDRRMNADVDVDTRVPESVKKQPEVLKMPTVEIDGYRYIGTLEIPGLGIRLPVMEMWDYTRLKISPCRYSGNYFEDDLVICGHNYERHFSPIKNVAVGEDVYFITADKTVFHYTVSNVKTLQPTSVDLLTRNRNNSDIKDGSLEAWDLSLFTCNAGGQTRCVVRCVRV